MSLLRMRHLVRMSLVSKARTRTVLPAEGNVSKCPGARAMRCIPSTEGLKQEKGPLQPDHTGTQVQGRLSILFKEQRRMWGPDGDNNFAF